MTARWLRRFMLSVVIAGLHGVASPASAQTAVAQPSAQPQERFPPRGWPSPVDDRRPHTFILADKLDVTPRSGGDVRWDMNGWSGGDINRVWFKSEGEQTFGKAERNIDAQVLYGRFFGKYYDAQVGGGIQTATFEGRNVNRFQAVVGLEALVPFRSDVENLLFVSDKGDVSARVTATRDYMVTQRLVLAPRVETTLAAQQVKEFMVGSGVNSVEIGFRMRYDIRRGAGPYVGISFERLFFGTADLARAAGRDVNRSSVVFGFRMWR